MDKYREFIKTKFAGKKECQSLIDIYNDRSYIEYHVKPDSNGMGVSQDYVDFEYEDLPTMYEKVRAAIISANINAGWNFNLTDFHQPLRISKYEAGYSHDWHLDYVSTDKSKVAFSCLLNSDFVGGQFQALEVKVPPISVGEAVIFPAYHGHRVTEVTSGTRLVLLAWYTGPRFV